MLLQLKRSLSLLAVAALSLGMMNDTAQAQIVPQPTLSGSDQLDKGIDRFNNYYGGTVYCTGWNFLVDIADEPTRQAVLKYLVLNSYFPTGSYKDPKTLVPATIADDPSLEAQDLIDLYTQIDNSIDIGDSVGLATFLSADVGAFLNVVVYDANAVVYTPLLGEVRVPGLGGVGGGLAAPSGAVGQAAPGPVDTWSGGTSYLWGSDAETFDAKIEAVCKDGQLIDCTHKCDAASGFLASAEIGCKEVETAENCCKLQYEYAWATGFKSVEVTGGGTGVKVTGYIGQSGGGSGSLLACCD